MIALTNSANLVVEEFDKKEQCKVASAQLGTKNSSEVDGQAEALALIKPLQDISNKIGNEIKALNDFKEKAGSEILISMVVPENSGPMQSVFKMPNVWTSVTNKNHLYKDETKVVVEVKKEEEKKTTEIIMEGAAKDTKCCIIL